MCVYLKVFLDRDAELQCNWADHNIVCIVVFLIIYLPTVLFFFPLMCIVHKSLYSLNMETRSQRHLSEIEIFPHADSLCCLVALQRCVCVFMFHTRGSASNLCSNNTRR